MKLSEYLTNPNLENKENTHKMSGLVLKTTEAAGQLTDGNIYIVENVDDALLTRVNNYLTVCVEHGINDGWTFEHEAHCILENEIQEESEALFAEKDNYNIMIPLFTPNSLEKHILLAKVSVKEVEEVLPELINRSEEICKAAMVDSMKNLASQEPDAAVGLLKEITREDLGTVGKKAIDFVGKVFCNALAPHAASIMPFNVQEDVFSFREKIFNNYLCNIDLLKTLDDKKYLGQELSSNEREVRKRIVEEIASVEKEICGNKNAVRMMRAELKKKMDEDREGYFKNCINRYEIAKQCPLVVGIKQTDKEYTSHSANKKYRVFIKYGGQEVFVNFGRSHSVLVYMMYLIDRKNKKGQASKIKFNENESAFEYLYMLVNNVKRKEIARSEYNKIIGYSNSNGIITKQHVKPSLAVCFTQIQDFVVIALEQLNAVCGNAIWKEIEHYLLALTAPNMNSHITLMPENIEICPEMKEISIL